MPRDEENGFVTATFMRFAAISFHCIDLDLRRSLSRCRSDSPGRADWRN